jgi:MFS family permease
MFALSIVSGRLADRGGRGPLAGALFLLGLGWNLCFVGGSALLADYLTPKERSHAQGFNDLLIGLASAMGSLGSGAVLASMGFVTVNGVGMAFVLVILAVTVGWRLRMSVRVPGLRSALGSA